MRRSACGAQLAILTDQLAQMCRLAGSAMERATQALLQTDLHLAEQVIGDCADVASAKADVEATGFVLLARHAPLARDLRTTVGCLQIVADVDRMSVLALHVAETVRRRHPRPALPGSLTAHFADMGRIATDLAESAYQSIASCDLARARYIQEADAAMDRLHRELFAATVDREWRHGAATAVDVTQLGRYYERFADHAVTIAKRVVYVATGEPYSTVDPEAMIDNL